MDELRIGVIGAGNAGVGSSRGNFVDHVCRVLGGARVTAVFDVLEENARRAAADIADCRAFGPGDWPAFLDSGIQAAVVASPIPFHARQSIECLDRGLHVLCEVTAAADVTEAQELVRASARSTATYMLAENCNFMDEIEQIRQMVRRGDLGNVYHAESGYLHDCKHLWRQADGTQTWRGSGGIGVYCTHSLGPVLDILDDRVERVSCMAHSASMFDAENPAAGNFSQVMRTVGGATIGLRIDTMSPRPYALPFRFQGTRGACEFVYGEDKEPRVSLGDAHEWRPLGDVGAGLPAAARDVPEEARSIGHGTMEYWMMKAWLEAVREGDPVPIDVYRALDYTLPGIIARESALRDGEPLTVPDPREWAEGH